ncbi:unnamed protein product, partial [Laminaria digitata]
MKQSKEPLHIFTRRNFLKTAGSGLTFAVAIGASGASLKLLDGSALAEKMVGPWVKISTDGSILILNPAAEMGQGTMTALPLIIAEEMDADWSKVKIEHSPVDPEIYGRSWRPGGSKNMMTVGSQAVRGYFTNLRKAGAQIRRVLLQSAAQHWDLPVNELTTAPGIVVHKASGKQISYGDLASIAVVPDELPEASLKSPAEFRLIGTSMPRHDIPAKTDGTALYAMDVKVPDMAYAMITRSPVHNGRPESYNQSDIESMPGVISTISMDYGVGILGESIEVVLKARKQLKVEWSGAVATGLDSQEKLASYAGIAGGDRLEARSVVDQGDASAVMATAAKRYTADFYSDHVY